MPSTESTTTNSDGTPIIGLRWLRIKRYSIGRPWNEKHFYLFAGRWIIHYRRRKASAWMGRFGGGWQWALGIQGGGSTIMFKLLFAELSIWRTKEKDA